MARVLSAGPLEQQPRSTGLPGLLLCAVLAAAGYFVAGLAADVAGTAGRVVSPVFVVILLGILMRSLDLVPEASEAGLKLALDKVLKLGVVLLGIRLSFGAVTQLGLGSLPVIALTITTAIAAVTLLARWMRLPGRLGTLIAVGTSICGCTAIMTAAPVIRARQNEICYAVGCVALFGLIGMLAYPLVAHYLFADAPRAAGMFLGTAIHDTAQVIAAGMIYEQNYASAAAMDAATVTKLVRNLCILLVVPVLAWVCREQADDAAAPRRPWTSMVPLFVLGFVFMSLVRTVGDYGAEPFGGLLTESQWASFTDTLKQIAAFLLTVAMAAVGLNTRLDAIRALGMRPLIAGTVAAAVVAGVSLLLISAWV